MKNARFQNRARVSQEFFRKWNNRLGKESHIVTRTLYAVTSQQIVKNMFWSILLTPWTNFQSYLFAFSRYIEKNSEIYI